MVAIGQWEASVVKPESGQGRQWNGMKFFFLMRLLKEVNINSATSFGFFLKLLLAVIYQNRFNLNVKMSHLNECDIAQWQMWILLHIALVHDDLNCPCVKVCLSNVSQQCADLDVKVKIPLK